MPSPTGFLTSQTPVRRFAWVLILTTFSSTSFTQSDQPQNVIVSLDTMAKAVERLQNQVQPKTPEVSTRLNQIKAHVSELQNVVRSRPAVLGPEPRLYRENLESFSRVLIAVAEHAPPTDRLLDQLNSIERDLAIKKGFASSSRGEPLSQIQTVVYTVDKEERGKGGYEIWYVPKGLEDYSQEFKRFDNLSTPAIMSLPPGNYVLWTTKDNVTSDRRPLTLGDDGRSKREFTLVVK